MKNRRQNWAVVRKQATQNFFSVEHIWGKLSGVLSLLAVLLATAINKTNKLIFICNMKSLHYQAQILTVFVTSREFYTL